MSKKKKTIKKSVFKDVELEKILSNYKPYRAYSFTKRENPSDFSNLISLLQKNYAKERYADIESIDLVYSGSTEAPYQLTLAVGRNDTSNQSEQFDIDVVNIAPDAAEVTGSYLRQQWHHFKNKDGERASFNLNPTKIYDETIKKNLTYDTILTGSVSYSSLEEYEAEKPDFYEFHKLSFEDFDK